MEIKNPQFEFGKSVLSFFLIAYVAILSISNTIALRNVLILICIVLILIYISIEQLKKPDTLRFLVSRIPKVFILWAIFLVMFPLWATEPDVAWKNLRSQWSGMLLAWCVGFTAVFVLGRRSPSLWVLALASAFPVLVHLVLTAITWAGLTRNELTMSPSIYGVGLLVKGWFSAGLPAISFQPFPMGFRGIEPMHGNIGYAACQTIALAVACFFNAWRNNNLKKILQSGLLIVLSFGSVLIAYSRGAVIFGVLITAVAYFLYVLKYQVNSNVGKSLNIKLNIQKFTIVGIFVCGVFLIGIQSIKDDGRWHIMMDKVELGLSVQQPEKILCEGLSEESERMIREQFAERNKQYVDDLIMGLIGQDGARLLLMREGWDLVKNNPVGLDGSRQSYEKLMLKTCGHTPILNHAHAHQAWINITLALGWLGGLLFAALLCYFVLYGWHQLGPADPDFLGFALCLISIFWFFRGFFDAVYQDHYLQMQGIIIAFLYSRLKYGNNFVGRKIYVPIK